jgi:hypothetical protein
MNFRTIINDCIDDIEEEYHVLCFKRTSRAPGYLLYDGALSAKIFPGVSVSYLQHIPINMKIVNSLWKRYNKIIAKGFCIILWSRSEGLLGSIYLGKQKNYFNYNNISAELYFGGHIINLNDAYHTRIHIGTRSCFTYCDRLYNLHRDHIDIFDGDGVDIYGIRYNREEGVDNLKKVSTAFLHRFIKYDVLTPPIIRLFRKVIRSRLRRLLARSRPDVFNPFTERTYTTEYGEFTIDLLKRNVDIFAKIIKNIVLMQGVVATCIH